MKYCMLILIPLSFTFSGCGSVGNTVLQDFGLQERPEGYESGSDQVMKNMTAVGKTEMKRLNLEGRRGEIKFEESELDGSGVYYKEVKIYENFYPLEANPGSRNSQSKSAGYIGYMEFAYEYYQSPRKKNRVEAEAAATTIPSRNRGRDAFRYRFNSGGVWNGGKGERMRDR